jgi:hypothetical protein
MALSDLPARLARLTAWFPRPCFVDGEGTASDVHAVEGVNGAFRRAAVRHLDDAKAARATGLAVRLPHGFHSPRGHKGGGSVEVIGLVKPVELMQYREGDHRH